MSIKFTFFTLSKYLNENTVYVTSRGRYRSLGQKYHFWVSLGLIERDTQIFVVNTTGNSMQKVFMKICDSK